MEDAKEIINKFAELKKEEKIIAALIDELKPKVYEALFSIGLDEEHPVELPGVGSFTYGNRPKYEFSPAVKAMQQEVKDMEKEEIQTGVAIKKDSPYAVFKSEGEE